MDILDLLADEAECLDQEDGKDETVSNIATEKQQVDDNNQQGKIPITIIAGFLGNGKTTLVKHILENTENVKIGVIVNDVAAINVDSNLIKRESKGNVETVELQNGCACCSASDDLYKSLRKLLSLGRFEHVVVECSGVVETKRLWALLESILEQQEEEDDELFRDVLLAHCVTVVDSSQFVDTFQSHEQTRDEKSETMTSRFIADLLSEHVESADLVIANKMDLVKSDKDRSVVLECLRTMNPAAELITAEYSKVPLDFLTKRTTTKKNASLNVEEEHQVLFNHCTKTNDHNAKKPKLEVYGVKSFVYKSRMAFDPKKFAIVMDTERPDCIGKQVLRSKGYVWLQNHPSTCMYWSQTGIHKSLNPLGVWWCEVPKEEWPTSEMPEYIMREFAEGIGDRRQEIVFIGIDIDEVAIRKALDECLLSPAEMEELKKICSGLPTTTEFHGIFETGCLKHHPTSE